MGHPINSQTTKTVFNEEKGCLEIISLLPPPTPAEIKERKRVIAQCGHVKRRLVRSERLTGKVLEFALDIVGENPPKDISQVPEKLKTGQQLSDYELHIMVDVLLLHVRLAA